MAMNRAELRAAIRANRRDPAGILHIDTEMNDAINEAIRRIPEQLWIVDIDTSLTSIASTRRYALTGLAWATTPGQIQRVFMEADDDHFYPLGRWHVEDDAGALTLVLDEDPEAASLTIRIEGRKPHAELSAEDVDSTMDADWLILKTTVLLLLKADPRYESPESIAADVARFEALRQAREAELIRQVPRKPGKVRTMAWHQVMGDL